MKKDDYQKFNYILGMEDENIKNILKIIEIDSCYYGNFNTTYDDIKYRCEKFLEYILYKKTN